MLVSITHAEACWGKDVVKSRLAGITAAAPRDGNIFSSFARTGQRPVKVTHRTHTQSEFRAHIVRWLAEANDTSDGDEDTSSELSLELDDDDSSLPDLADVSDSESLADDDEGEDAWDDMDEVEKADIIERTKQAKAVISRVRKFSFALVHSTTRALPAWRSAFSTKNMAVRLLPRDVRARWNSTYDMLVVAVQYNDVVNTVTADRNLPLRKYELSDIDSMIVEDVIFKQATLLFSSDNRSTIANVITTMDKIDDLITTTIVSTQLLQPAFDLRGCL
ncbi:hypothetical protein B0H10DRAFT_2222260 [Mycena sp. CBHHK59/15]|nr:hypothetical protein B0H10DRAFT_2222260 [Mycena sp. CBHHK59/15]